MFARQIRRERTASALPFALCRALVVAPFTFIAICGYFDSALAARPSNADTAFRQVPLNPPSSGSGYVPNQGHGQWPLSLENPALIWPIGGIDSVLIASKRLQGVRINLDGSVTYSLPPNTRANRIAVIVTANDGTDPLDYNFPLLFVSCAFGDGRTWGSTSLPGLFNTKDLAFGHDVRNWSNQVSPSQPLFVAKPPAPTTFEVFAGPGIGGPDSVFFDIQTVDIPDTLRSAPLSTVTFTSSSFFTTTTGLISGLAVWPQFKVENGQGDTLVRQSQFTNRDHGGYLFGSLTVGTRRTTNQTACQVASMAMCYTFAGFPCTVDSLNAHLQRNRGYLPSDVCIVTWVSPTGDAIRYRPYTQDDTRLLPPNDEFLVERGNYMNPLATFRVTASGQAALVPPRHNLVTPVAVGDTGRVYWNMKRRVADAYTENPHLVSKELGESPGLAALVESLLVRNVPVQLNLATYGHFVVADGWTPSFRPGSVARGTYSIRDPYDFRNFTRLIESRLIPGPNPKVANYSNRFRLARWVEPAPGPRPPGPDAISGTGITSLSVVANGTRRLELVDPIGRRLLRDAGTDEDVAEIPDAWVMDVGSEHDNEDEWDDRQTGYEVDVAEALDGHYQLRVYADEGHALNISAYDETGVISTDAAGDTAVVPIGASYDLHYSAAARTVAVSYLGPLGVEPPAARAHRIRLAVRRNPAGNPVEFVIIIPPENADVIDVFDPGGRRVGTVLIAPGQSVGRWDWRGGRIGAGVYLARLRSGSAAVRFVVLK